MSAKHVAIAAALCASAVGVGAQDSMYTPFAGQRVDVTFAINRETEFGTSIFLLGDLPELGGNVMNRAVKLEPSTYPTWRATLSLPAGTTYSYRYVTREDGVTRLSDNSNGLPILGPFTSTTASAPALTRDVRVFAAGSSATSVEIIDARGTTRATAPLVSGADGYLAATDLPYFPGDTVRLLGASGLIVARTTDAQRLYFRADGLVADWRPLAGTPAGTYSAPRVVTHPGFASPQLSNTRTIRVLLPRGYDENTLRRYPVLYMHDGQNVFDPGGAFGSWSLNVSVPQLVNEGAIPEIIVVGIDNIGDAVNRTREYAPPYDSVFAISGIGDRYRDFVVDTVAPFIDATYRTIPDKDARLVGGSSMGGVISSYIAWERPGFATRYFVMSPAYWLTGNIRSRFDTESPRPVVFYLDSGDQNTDVGPPFGNLVADGLLDTIRARDTLMKPGKYAVGGSLLFVIGYGQQHNEAAWKVRFPGALHSMFRGAALRAPRLGEPSGVIVR